MQLSGLALPVKEEEPTPAPTLFPWSVWARALRRRRTAGEKMTSALKGARVS